MAKKDLDLFAIIVDALEYYHTYVAPTIKESTKRQNLSLLSEFKRFLDSLPKRDYSMAIFSQKGLNRYKKYLIDKMNKSKTDGKKKNFGVGQVNHCGSIIARLINQVLIEKYDDLNPVIWNKVKDTRREDEFGHIPLNEEEVGAIENCSDLKEKDQEYRNVFLLQIECGQRFTDLRKLLKGEYEILPQEPYDYIVLVTTKENTKAYIELNPKMKKCLECVQSLRFIDPEKFHPRTYNDAIRRIAKTAKLDREIIKRNAHGEVEKGPLFEVISSHDARCTFITNKIMEGESPDDVCRMTGHTSDEMIKRVYAQLTDAGVIKKLESRHKTQRNESCSSESEHQLNQDTPIDTATITAIQNELEPTSLFESKEFIAFEKYIDGFDESIDNAIKEAYSKFPDDEDEDWDRTPFFDGIRSSVITIISGQEIISKEAVINSWNGFNETFTKVYSDSGISNDGLNLARLECLSEYIDILKDKQVEEEIITALEQIFYDICKENPDAGELYRNTLLKRILWPILRFYIVFSKASHFIQENRPIADKSMINDEDDIAFKDRPDWSMVFRELQIMPEMKLETLVQNTKCRPEIKTAIFNYVRNGNFDDFARTIDPNENEVRILISQVYLQRYLRNLVQAVDYMVNKLTNEPADLSYETIDRLRVAISLQNPFVGIIDEKTPVFLKKETKDIDTKEANLWLLDGLLKAVDDMKKDAYPSEIKVLNRILSLVDMDQHPELNKAYEEYKAKSNTSPDSKQTEEVGILQNTGNELEKAKSPKDLKKESNKDPKDKEKVANYITFSKRNLDIDKLVRLLTEPDKINGNTRFITLIQCDTQSADVATCLKHFLGITSPTPLSFKLKWNENKVGLKLLIRLLVNTNEKATRKNVIKYRIVDGVPKPYDGISNKYISDGKGQTAIWPSVREAFQGCKSISQADLGDTESAWKKNKKQLETVAEIYFACKK